MGGQNERQRRPLPGSIQWRYDTSTLLGFLHVVRAFCWEIMSPLQWFVTAVVSQCCQRVVGD